MAYGCHRLSILVLSEYLVKEQSESAESATVIEIKKEEAPFHGDRSGWKKKKRNVYPDGGIGAAGGGSESALSIIWWLFCSST
ncbi:hypothetical protein F511_15498 [Dorcoceras hygrometricum]|uniref:Uncharacterized protein n=1 Tax=Dorcoceras hygrometricum TaxID=472368 RepID=A0A2Z7DEF8_9LAMI|nr:hypothetical protein F511_15498 [Dorcoceras hygrometricum]